MPEEQIEINKVSKLSKERLNKIGSQVVEEYTADLESRSVWDSDNAKHLKLFAGQVGKKSIPNLENASNVCIPMIGVAALQFQARAYDSLIPGKQVVRTMSTDEETLEAAKRVEKHMNWQLQREIPYFEKGMDKLCLKLPIFGSAYKKTFYDHKRKIVNSKLIKVSNLITPYGCEELQDCERITHVLELSPNEVAVRDKRGIFLNTDKLYSKKKKADTVLPGSGLQTESLNQTKQVIDELEGIEESRFMEDKPRVFLEQHRLLDLNGDGIGEPYVVTVDQETNSVVRIVSREYLDPFTGNKATWNYFTDYSFIPNPESHYSYGFGILMTHLNNAGNSILNELIDAGNLNNMQSGFVNMKSGIKKGDLGFKRGELKPIESRTEDLKKDIFLFDFKPPSQALFTLLGLIQSYGKEISSVSDAMIGKLPSSDTTATSFMASLEQGLKVFSVIHKRIHRSFEEELRKIFLLNRLYLKDSIYFTVQNSKDKTLETLQSGREDYLSPIDIIPVSDPSIISKVEKTQKASLVYQMVTSNPILAQNEVAIVEAAKNVLEANEVQNVEKYLPDLETFQPRDYSPVEENARFLRDLNSPVLPEQNHEQHLREHKVFVDSVFGGELSPQGRTLMEAHNKEHISGIYLASESQKSSGEDREDILDSLLRNSVIPGVQ